MGLTGKCQFCLAIVPMSTKARLRPHIDTVTGNGCPGTHKMPGALSRRHVEESIARNQQLFITHPQHTAELTERLAQLQPDPLDWLDDPEINC